MGLIDKIKAEVEKKTHGEQGYSSGDAECGYRDCAREILSFINTLEVKEVDLEKELDRYTTNNFWTLDGNDESPYLVEKDDMLKVAKHFFELGLREKDVNEIIKTAEDHAYFAGCENTRKNLWHPADGDDLPEIDREVIVLLSNNKVCFAHRPQEYWDGKNIATEEITRYYPKRYDKGGWNIPDVKWWLDLDLPNMEE